MKIEDVAKLEPAERFLYWIREREQIRLLRKKKKPKPWTDDSILQSYRFCNVVRMDDKVSRWLLKHWYKPNFDHPNMLIACALARFINLPTALEVIGFPKRWRPNAVKAKLRKHRDAGNNVFNGAYVVSGKDGLDKIESVVDFYVHPLKRCIVDTNSMEQTWTHVLGHYGFGPFMAGQVVADLRWAMKGKWRDRNRWAPIGPGSRRGLNRLLEQDIKTPIKQEEFEKRLRQMIVTCETFLPLELTNRMEAMDWQNCLCEFDKYSRALLGEGRPKQLYPGI